MMRIKTIILLTLMCLPVAAGAAHAQASSSPVITPAELALEIEQSVQAGAEIHPSASTGLPQFDPTWFASQIFWLVIAFGILYAVFARRTLPTISSTIENRRNHIQADLARAEELTAQAETVQTHYELGLQGARDQASAMIADVHALMQQAKTDQSESFRLKSEKDVSATEMRLAAAKDKAMSEISDIVAEVAAQAVQKIVGISTDAQQARTIVSRLADNKAKAA